MSQSDQSRVVALPVSRRGERGSAMVAVLIVMAVLLVLINGLASVDVAAMRGEEQEESALQEKWTARGGASLVSGYLQNKMPQFFADDVAQARAWATGRETLVAFDETNIPQAESRPIARVNGAGVLERSEFELDVATSLLGSGGLGESGPWALARAGQFRAYANSHGYAPDMVNVFSIRETERRASGFPEPSYVLTYIIDAKAGYARYRHSRQLLLGARGVTVAGCSTTVALNVAPPVITQGQTVALQATYTGANVLRFYEGGGTLLHAETVVEDSNPNIFTYTVTPAASTTYYVEAVGPGLCFARTSPEAVTVNPPPPLPLCPTINFFTASSTNVTPGSTVTLSWNVSDANEVRLDGSPVPAVSTQSVVVNTTTTFTLTATGPGNACPQTSTLRVTVDPIGGCPTPIIEFFTANPTSVQPNESVTLSWNVTNLRPGAVVTLTGPGLSQTVSASGSVSVTPPPNPGTYVYRLRADQPCGTEAEQALTVTVTNSCPPPVIDAFSATPNSVVQGVGGVVRLSWNISGTADAVSIDNGVGGGLPPSGSVDIPAPAVTTTYTLTVVGCGQTRSAQVPVQVTGLPPNPSCPQFPPQTLLPSNSPRILNFSKFVPFVGANYVLLQWQSLNADAATLNGVPVSPSNYEPLVAHGYQVPANDTDYVLEVWRSSNPGVRDRHTLRVSPNPPLPAVVPMNLDLSQNNSETDNHRAGEPVTIHYSTILGTGNPGDATVEVVGVANNLPGVGSITLPAPTSTTEYHFIARRGAEVAPASYTIIVEDPNNMGPGYVIYGDIEVERIAGNTHHVGRALVNRLSNGSLRMQLLGGLLDTVFLEGGGRAGLTDVPPGVLRFGGSPLLRLLRNGAGIEFPAGRVVNPVGNRLEERMIPASAIPNARNCDRYDFIFSSQSITDSFGFTNAPLVFSVDTRVSSPMVIPPGFTPPPPVLFSNSPLAGYREVQWTEAEWIRLRDFMF